MPTHSDKPWAVCVFLCLLWAYAYFFQGGSWSSNARYDLVRAMVEDRAWRINRFAVNTYDIAVVYDPQTVSRRDVYARYHEAMQAAAPDLAALPWPIYANKAPAVSWLGAPMYALMHAIERAAGLAPDAFWVSNINVHLLSVISTGLPSALMGMFVFLWLGRRTDLSVGWRLSVTAGVSLGTLVWPYSTGMYGHATAAAFLFLSFYAADTLPEMPRPGRRALAAGLLAGLAVASEYTAAVPAAGLTVFAAVRARRAPPVAAMLAGGALVALVLGAYHAVLLGNPLQTTYAWQRPHLDELAAIASGRKASADWSLRRALFAWPDWRLLGSLTFGLHRGVFITSPLLLAGLIGLVVWLKRHRAMAVLAIVVFAYYLLLNSTYAEWDGGSAFGPRYLIPAMPLLALPVAALCRGEYRGLVACLLAVSIGIQLMGASVRVEVPNIAGQPPVLFVAKRFTGLAHRDGKPMLSTNAQHVSEARPDRANAAGLPRRWCSYNLGELMGLGRLASLAPLPVGWLAIVLLVWTAVRLRRGARGEADQEPGAGQSANS